MLSTGARRLYRRLLELGPVAIADAPVDGPDDERLVALRGLGLVHDADGCLDAVTPSTAKGRVLAELGQRSRDLIQHGLEVESFLDACLREPGPAGDAARAVEILSGEEVRMLSGTLPRQATDELLAVNTASFPGVVTRLYRTGPTPADHASGVRYRVIYDPALVGGAGLVPPAGFEGEEGRIHPGLVLKFKIVDGSAAIVPLDVAGQRGGLLIRAPALCRLLVDYFERLWAESTPIGATRTDRTPQEFNAVQLRVLGLVADDVTDAEICVRVGISDRTLRRHVGVILRRLGVSTRAGAVAIGLRRGWLS